MPSSRIAADETTIEPAGRSGWRPTAQGDRDETARPERDQLLGLGGDDRRAKAEVRQDGNAAGGSPDPVELTHEAADPPDSDSAPAQALGEAPLQADHDADRRVDPTEASAATAVLQHLRGLDDPCKRVLFQGGFGKLMTHPADSASRS